MLRVSLHAYLKMLDCLGYSFLWQKLFKPLAFFFAMVVNT